MFYTVGNETTQQHIIVSIDMVLNVILGSIYREASYPPKSVPTNGSESSWLPVNTDEQMCLDRGTLTFSWGESPRPLLRLHFLPTIFLPKISVSTLSDSKSQTSHHTYILYLHTVTHHKSVCQATTVVDIGSQG